MNQFESAALRHFVIVDAWMLECRDERKLTASPASPTSPNSIRRTRSRALLERIPIAVGTFDF